MDLKLTTNQGLEASEDDIGDEADTKNLVDAGNDNKKMMTVPSNASLYEM
jgi:hypothetical protein